MVKEMEVSVETQRPSVGVVTVVDLDLGLNDEFRVQNVKTLIMKIMLYKPRDTKAHSSL